MRCKDSLVTRACQSTLIMSNFRWRRKRNLKQTIVLETCISQYIRLFVLASSLDNCIREMHLSIYTKVIYLVRSSTLEKTYTENHFTISHSWHGVSVQLFPHIFTKITHCIWLFVLIQLYNNKNDCEQQHNASLQYKCLMYCGCILIIVLVYHCNWWPPCQLWTSYS